LSIFKAFIIYICLVVIWLVLLKFYQWGLFELKYLFINKMNELQIRYLKNANIKRLVRSIKFEMFIEDKINKIMPYFPYSIKDYYPDKELMYEIENKNEKLRFFLIKLLPLRVSNLIFILLILYFYLKIDVVNIMCTTFHLDTKDLISLIGKLPIVPSLIVVTMIVISFFFTSRKGMLIRAKNKVRMEELENKIKFHKTNRIILSKILNEGYNNVQYIIQMRSSLLDDIKKKKDISFNDVRLKDIQEIEELDQFVSKYEDSYKDLFPFFIGIKHISFMKLHNIYDNIFSLQNRISSLKAIFLTKEYMESFVNKNRNYSSFEKMLNVRIIESVKTLVLMRAYLDIINNYLNKSNRLYSFLAFITNKDK
jgi:hypothetical protein